MTNNDTNKATSNDTNPATSKPGSILPLSTSGTATTRVTASGQCGGRGHGGGYQEEE